MAKHRRLDYIQTDLIEAVQDARQDYTSTFQRASTEFQSYVDRLQECRKRKLQEELMAR